MKESKIYPRTGDRQTVYLKQVVTDPGITVGDYTMYNDFVNDPAEFEKNNVLYHYPINHDRLVIGKFCSIACGTKFLLTAPTAAGPRSLHTPFPSSLRSGGSAGSVWPTHGTTKEILSSAAMSGLDLRRSFWRA